MGKGYYNSEGYADPTAYYAILKSEREEREKRKKQRAENKFKSNSSQKNEKPSTAKD